MAFPSVSSVLEMNVMKKSLLLACVVLFAGAAFAQSSVGASSLSNEAQPIVMPSHPSQASERGMMSGKSLLTGSGSISAKGERPLWKLAPNNVPVPLGDSARVVKKQHAEAKKAQVTWVN
jgi:hypothetical protein